MATLSEKQEEKRSTVWSTRAVEKYIDDIDSGIERKGECPLFNGSKKYRKANLLFEYTQEEVAELLKCKNDVRYFANHYAWVKNAAEGGAVAPITLRDYQEDVLDVIDNNRFSIILASRQSGKCCEYSTLVETENGNVQMGDMLECNNSFLSKIKRFLYKIYHRL